jgi:hypothetical protein
MGTIRLVSDSWDNIAQVEIVSGMNAPDQGSSDNLINVQRGWSDEYQQRVCYRRSRDPSRADSGLGDWNCFTRTISGIEVVSLR